MLRLPRPTLKPYSILVQKAFFHDLYSLQQVNLVPLPIIKLQYRSAALYHNIEPEKNLDKSLANHWIEKIPSKQQLNAAKLYQSKTWTRGEFLSALYQLAEYSNK